MLVTHQFLNHTHCRPFYYPFRIKTRVTQITSQEMLFQWNRMILECLKLCPAFQLFQTVISLCFCYWEDPLLPLFLSLSFIFLSLNPLRPLFHTSLSDHWWGIYMVRVIFLTLLGTVVKLWSVHTFCTVSLDLFPAKRIMYWLFLCWAVPSSCQHSVLGVAL